MIRNGVAAISHAAALVGVCGHAANNYDTTLLRPDGSTCSAVIRDSVPLTFAERKAEREAAKTRKRDRISAAADARAADVAARKAERAVKRRAAASDLARRTALGTTLARAAGAADELAFDWSLTHEPCYGSSAFADDCEALFEADDMTCGPLRR